MSYYPYLNDKEFLKLVDQARHKEQFVRIFVLNFNTEEVIASIEGKSTGGSINVSGTSSLRRSGSCSIAVDPAGIEGTGCPLQYGNILEVQNLLSLNKKVRIETGYWNNIEQEFGHQAGSREYYSDYNIIWLPLGVYIIKNASVSENNSGMNISLTLNDKSAQLNGTCGGIIPAGTVFSEIETLSADGLSRTIEYPLIKDIVRSLVVEFGGEKPDNIIIEDIPDTARKGLKWNGTEPVYLYEGDTKGQNKVLSTNAKLTNCGAKDPYTHGQNIGFQQVPFTYPGKLECNAGEAVSSVLDKIKNTLGNFEWFYDVFGRFHFQAQKNYLNTGPTADIKNYTSADYLSVMNMAAPAYSFTDRTLLSSISVAPQYDNIKNDFLVWGTAKTVTGADKPIRYRVAIETKPLVRMGPMTAIVYKDYRDCWAVIPTNEDNFALGRLSTGSDKNMYYYDGKNVWAYDKVQKVFRTYPNYIYCSLLPSDWRSELYFRGLERANQPFVQNPYAAELNFEFPKIYDVFATQLQLQTLDLDYVSDFPLVDLQEGDYTKIEGFVNDYVILEYLEWVDETGNLTGNKYGTNNVFVAYGYKKDNEGKTCLVLYPARQEKEESEEYIIDYDDAYFYMGAAELDGVEYDKWRKIETPHGDNGGLTWDAAEQQYCYTNPIVVPLSCYIGDYKADVQESNYEYWIDFIETDGGAPVSQLDVDKIGRRTKVVSDNKVTCLFNTEFPNYMYIEADGYVQDERDMVEPTGYEAIQVAQDVYKNITVGTTPNSAYDKIKELIQTHTQYNESVSLTTIPIYYLEPNTLIEVNHDAMGIHGNYLIKSISLPLVPSGTSNISATKSLQRMESSNSNLLGSGVLGQLRLS